MNLILHHLVKDIREHRWLLLLWAFFIMAYLVADLLIIQPKYDVAHLGETLLVSPLLGVGYSVVWSLLLVGLIQSEPVVGLNSFWLTRPLPRWVVIPSKLTFVVVFLIVPSLAIAPCEMLLLHVDPTLYSMALLPSAWTLGLTVVVLWSATFTCTLGGFFVASGLIILGLIGVFGVREFIWVRHMSEAYSLLGFTQISLAIYIIVIGLVVSIFAQQMFRKTSAGMWIAIGSVVVALLVGFFWPVALPNSLTLLNFIPGWTESIAQKNATVDFAPGWPASVKWSQPNQPNGATSTVAVYNGSVVGVSTARPVSTTDDEGNPVVIGALVASAQLTPATSSASQFPIIDGVEASFKPVDGPARDLPRRDSDVFSNKSTRFDLVKAVQADLPGITITASAGGGSTLSPTTLFKLDAENLDRLRGKTGELTLQLYGYMQTLSRVAAIPLEGEASSRIPNGMVHVHFTTRQTQSIFGIDLPLGTKDKPMLAVWQVAYEPPMSRLQDENYYILVDTTTHTGVVLSNVDGFSRRTSGGIYSRASWNEYLTLPFDATSKEALAHKVLYIYTSMPQAHFNAKLTASGFTMSPP